MMNPERSSRSPRSKRLGRAALWTLAGAAALLGAEALLPARAQPTARACLWLIEAYQSVGSPVAQAGGIQCKYRPTCSHYAHDAIEHYGTVRGVAKAAGRLWRCSPWGGCGYDPAVTRGGFLQEPKPRQETDEERAKRETQEAIDEAKKHLPEAAAAAAGCAAVWVGCIIVSVGSYVVIIIIMIWAYKDAKSRGDQNAAIWLILIFFAHFIGFVIYLLVRPKGTLVPCANCQNSKMESLTKCPHCGAEAGAAKA